MHLKPHPLLYVFTSRTHIFPKDTPKLKELYEVNDEILELKLRRRSDCVILTAPPSTQGLACTVKSSASCEED